MIRVSISIVSLLAVGVAASGAVTAQAPTAAVQTAPAVQTVATPIPLPDWLFPIDPKAARALKNPPKTPPPKLDDVEPLGVPGSDVKLTLARIHDTFNAPDWRPDAHGPAPDIVMKGRKPDNWACAYCHTPTGQGRPENAPVAGLPEAYVKQQLIDYRSGARKPQGPDEYAPGRGMVKAAKGLTDAEIDAAAKYFSQQKALRRAWVVEGLRMPRVEPANWLYSELGGMEDVEVRLIEATAEPERHEHRDDRLEYNAYVPPGAITAGKLLVTKGGGKTQACATCHLQNLHGTEQIPPLNGRSPTYLLRQLLAFRNGTRTNAQAAQMTPVVEKLELEDMIAIAAYLGSLNP